MRIRRIGCICAYALHVIGSRASPPRRAAIFNFLQRFELRYFSWAGRPDPEQRIWICSVPGPDPRAGILMTNKSIPRGSEVSYRLPIIRVMIWFVSRWSEELSDCGKYRDCVCNCSVYGRCVLYVLCCGVWDRVGSVSAAHDTVLQYQRTVSLSMRCHCTWICMLTLNWKCLTSRPSRLITYRTPHTLRSTTASVHHEHTAWSVEYAQV